MSELKFSFIQNPKDQMLNEIYNFDVKAFADSQDFDWTKENIKKELKEGWNIVSVKADNDIVCALFIKEEDKALFTKNTPIKITHQGNGYSHIIKDFYEDYAKDKGLKKVVNYCRDDNFRMISLNEGHHYVRTGKVIKGTANLIEWEKKLK
ncbi:MAG: hypothetical protein CME62_05910 [Halobacteriovoraceae bacterium]|nr:hypothetical protein [Halobacteriovoraceae bacterium]|tara:strand:- start:150 stop:602 length:453 start_codon:yes stop_codon:yes gene_type:complete